MKRFNFIPLFLFIFSITINAQTASKKPVKQCNGMLARQLVEQQAEISKTIEETDKRVNVLIKVADFLWIQDEESARRYFAEAFQIAQDRFREKGLEKAESKGVTLSKPDYRFEVVRAVARRDAEWAKKLSETILKESEENKETDKRNDFDRNKEVQQLLGIAASVAKVNPDLALSFARRVMRYPLSNSWHYNLFQMAGNNQPLANSIYAELLNNYADAEVFRLLYLSAYPFGRDRIFGIEKFTLGTWVPPNFAPNPNLQRQFLQTLFRRTLKLTPENTGKSLQTKTPESAVAIIALNELEPLIAQQFPDLMPMFNQAKIHANSIVTNEILDSANARNEVGKNFGKSFEEKIKELEKADADGKLKDAQIVGMIFSAVKEEDYKLAETWLDKIQSETGRESTANYFYFQRSKVATKDKRFDDARKYAEKVSKIEHRAILYFDIAEEKIKNEATKYASLDELLEVYKLAEKAPDSVEKAQIFLGLANIYEKINHSNALDAISNAVRTVNKLKNPNLFSTFLGQQIAVEGILVIASYDVPGFDLNKTFYEISQKDFQGALAEADNFTDKYLRTLAVLAVVKDCEKNDKPVKPPPKKK